MKLRRYTLSLLLCAPFLIGATCKEARLEPGGAYAPIVTNAATGVVSTNSDLAFYQIEASYAAAYAAIDGLFKFEADNEKALWAISPNIKLTLDKIRPDAWEANKSYHKARKAYLAVPVPANLTVLQQVLARMNQLLAAATAVMPKEGAK